MADNSGKDPLFFNKLAGALLTAAILIFGLPQLTAAMFGGGGHGGGHDDELHLAYCCVDLETKAENSGEPAPVDLGTLLADASASGGERRAGLCASCHTFNEGGANGTGPNLWNIVGRPVANVSGFNYSSALKEYGGEWTYERLDAYLKNSQEAVPGTAMNQRFAKDEQRADLLAYLASLSANPVPFPEPAAITLEEAAADAIESAEEIVEEAGDHASDAVTEEAEEAAENVEEALIE